MKQEITYIRNPPIYPVHEVEDDKVHEDFLKGELKVRDCIAYSEYKRLNNRTYRGSIPPSSLFPMG